MHGNLGNFPDTFPRYNSVYDKGTIPLRSNSEQKIGFFSGHSCLWKKKTNTNQQRIGCLVYPVITQIVNGPVEIMEELEWLENKTFEDIDGVSRKMLKNISKKNIPFFILHL